MEIKIDYGTQWKMMMEGETMLDLGCGRRKDRDKIGMDKDDYGQEIIWDAVKGIPLPDNCCKRIKAYAFFEHLSPDDVLFVMKECHRVLRKEGILDICVPFANSEGAMRDPTHKSHWMPATFDYFTKDRPRFYDLLPSHKWKIKELKQKDGGLIYAELIPEKD